MAVPCPGLVAVLTRTLPLKLARSETALCASSVSRPPLAGSSTSTRLSGDAPGDADAAAGRRRGHLGRPRGPGVAVRRAQPLSVPGGARGGRLVEPADAVGPGERG